jgi:hypothetical protein
VTQNSKTAHRAFAACPKPTTNHAKPPSPTTPKPAATTPNKHTPPKPTSNPEHSHYSERFFDGVEEPVYHLGRVVGTVRRYDNRVGMFMLKSLDPRFSDKVVHSHGVERDPEEEAALMRLLAAPGGVDAVTAAIEQVVVERLEDGDGDD